MYSGDEHYDDDVTSGPAMGEKFPPYLWQCEAVRCRERTRDMTEIDSGPGKRFHPGCQRLGHCTTMFDHSPLCDRDGRFCGLASSHSGECRPHGGSR